jgi:hypothetical protein
MNRNDEALPSGPNGGSPPNKKSQGGLLEDFSVHLSLPSFHTKTQGKMSWKCCACSYENCSTLSSDCSICGMKRSDIDEETAQGDASNWMNDSASTMGNSFGTFDGDNSSNSLSLHNSFSMHEDDLPFMRIEDESKLTPRTAKRATFNSSMPATLHSSFSSIRSTRSTRSAFRGRRSPRRAARAAVSVEPDLHSSVMSFCDWNPNEKIQSWPCDQCTFVNENPLHLACEMCGHRRKVPTNSVAAAAASQEEEEKEEEVHFADSNTDDSEEDLRLIQEEQMRELIEVQRDIMADFGRRTTSGGSTASVSGESSPRAPFDTRGMQREIGTIREGLPTIRDMSRESSRDEADDSEDDKGEEDRLEELLKSTRSMLQDFKQQRISHDYDSKPAAKVSPYASNVTNESIFGRTDPNQSAAAPTSITSLKYSMKASGGKLHHNDLTLPLLWGDNLGDLKKVQK